MTYCVTCGEGHPTLNPAAWLEHSPTGAHIFHPFVYGGDQ